MSEQTLKSKDITETAPGPSDFTWTSEELEKLEQCPACQDTQRSIRYEALSDVLENVPGQWSLYQCAACNSLYLNPRPRLRAIHKAYTNYFTHSCAQETHDSDRGDSWIWRLANGYMNSRYGSQRTPASRLGPYLIPLLTPLRQQLDYFYRHLPSTKGALLDVGCGNGVFLLRARDAGWDVRGIEPDPKAAQEAHAAGLNVFNGILEDFPRDKQFDVITASHVIEHVQHPVRFLSLIKMRLRTDGIAWIATPNASGLGHRIYQRHWRGLEVPRHLCIFSPPALRNALTATGFSDIRFHQRGRGSRYVVSLSQQKAREAGARAVNISHVLFDSLATINTTLAEELVVTARKLG